MDSLLRWVKHIKMPVVASYIVAAIECVHALKLTIVKKHCIHFERIGWKPRNSIFCHLSLPLSLSLCRGFACCIMDELCLVKFCFQCVCCLGFECIDRLLIITSFFHLIDFAIFTERVCQQPSWHILAFRWFIVGDRAMCVHCAVSCYNSCYHKCIRWHKYNNIEAPRHGGKHTDATNKISRAIAMRRRR